MKVKKKYLFNFFLILILLGTIVYAADYYKIFDLHTQTINETYVCTRVKNNNCNGTAIFIPTKTQGEWNSFNSSHPNCSTISQDFDGDGHLINASIYCPAYSGTVGDDCYDDNSSAYPGQTAWFLVDRGDGSFDYNCNGKIDYFYVNMICTSSSAGWKGETTPSCGNKGNYCKVDCSTCSTQTQKCH